MEENKIKKAKTFKIINQEKNETGQEGTELSI